MLLFKGNVQNSAFSSVQSRLKALNAPAVPMVAARSLLIDGEWLKWT